MSARGNGSTAEERPSGSPCEQGATIEDTARRLRQIVRDQGRAAGPLQLPEVAQSSLRERTEPNGHASRDPDTSGSVEPSVLSLSRKGQLFISRNFHGRVIQLSDLPRGIRMLAFLGYANVLVLLAALLFFELSGKQLTNVVAFDVDASMPHEVPFSSVVSSLVAFMVGWSLILTGASDCSRRVFFPVLGFFVLQMYLLAEGFGEAQWDSQGQVWWATVCVAGVVAGIHLFTHRLPYWRDRPLAEFGTWLVVMLVLLLLLLRLPQGEVALRVYYLAFFGLILITPFWLVLGLEIIDLAVTFPRWLVLGPG